MSTILLKRSIVGFASGMLVLWLVVGSVDDVEGSPFFYSISVQSGDDELVKVDAATGQVFTIGSLGPSVQMDFPSLAFANGRLFLVHSITAGDPVELLELDPSTGSILSSTQVTLGGSTIPLVEGFDSSGGQLVISYGLTSGGGTGFRSNRIGNLALDGTISSSVTLSGSDDLDGIAINNQGQYFGTDASGPNVGSDILSISLNPPSTTLLATIGSTTTDIVDLAFMDTGLLFGLDLNKRIHQIDPLTGNSLASVPFASSLTLRGLAVPEPSTLALAAFGFVALLAVAAVKR